MIKRSFKKTAYEFKFKSSNKMTLNYETYKITLRLKTEQYLGNGMHKFHLKNEVKIIPNNLVCFYALDFFDAIQCFNQNEVTGLK